MSKIIVIVGPTGVGKTTCSIKLAKHFNGEIINADSMQVYKDLNIGTAKITNDEKDNIKHHLFDIKNVEEDYSTFDYQNDCRKCIKKIQSINKTTIIVGGTGLYIKSALYNYQFHKENKNNKDYSTYSNDELYDLLLSVDPNTIVHKNNRKRVIRSLNYYYSTNKPLSSKEKCDTLLYNAVFIGLTLDKDTLYERINNRVDNMINNGLINEVKYFYDKNIRSKAINTGIGYKELYQYFDGLITLNEAIELIKKNSRNYAKKQYTWFNNQMNVKWFNVNDTTIDDIIKYIEQ